MKSPWFVNFSRSQQAVKRLFCFPYAGGNANVFRSWASMLPPSVELIGIQSPGKGSRIMERPCASIQEMIDGLLPALVPLLHERKFSFFGHSNGALIAFELSSVLQERGLPLPQHLFLSASPAPWTRVFDRPYSEMSDDEFAAILERLNGTPPEILGDRDLLELMLPGLRADFSLAENYKYARQQKLAIPTSIYYGEHDEIEESQIQSWQDQIDREARFERIPGGHFFIHSHVEQLTKLISGQLTELIAGGRSRAALSPM